MIWKFLILKKWTYDRYNVRNHLYVCTHVQSTNELLTQLWLWLIVYPPYLFMNIWRVSSVEVVQTDTLGMSDEEWDRSQSNINKELSFMLFSFGKCKIPVYFHFQNPYLLITGTSQSICLIAHPIHTHTDTHTHTHITPHRVLHTITRLCQQHHQHYLGLCVSFISSC